jgi:hypothetical protein
MSENPRQQRRRPSPEKVKRNSSRLSNAKNDQRSKQSTFNSTMPTSSSVAYAAKEAEKTIEYLHGSIHKDGYWNPTASLAGIFKLPLRHLELGHDESNAVWCTMLVLIHCMTALVDYHEYWRALVEHAREWLFTQRFFLTAQMQLIQRACKIMGDVDVKAMGATIFAKSEHEVAITEPPQQRGNWVEMFLDTPPYTKYYWNQVTRETRWTHPMDPLEITQAERDARCREKEKAKMVEERITKAKELASRIQININRSVYMPPRPQVRRRG